MTKRLLHKLSFAGIFVVILTSCKELAPPEYVEVNNLEFETKGFSNPTLSAMVRMYNPNKSNLTFKSGSLNIFMDNRLLGHTELDSTIHIKKLDTFQIPIRVNIEYKNVLGNALSLLMRDSVLIRLEGNIRVGRLGVFITRPVNYEQKERLDFFLKKSSRIIRIEDQELS